MQRARKRIDVSGQVLYATGLLAIMTILLLARGPISHWRPAAGWVDALKPGAGFEVVLPRDARDAVLLIRDGKLRRYALAPAIRKHPLIWQRTIEGAFPVRFFKGARDIITYAAGADRGGCRVVAVRGRMAHVRCRER